MNIASAMRPPARLRTGLAALVVALTLAGAALAGDFEEALAAYVRGDFATAFRLFQKRANEGDGDAQSNLGVMYAAGQGVAQSSTEAGRWYRKAAEQGNITAQYNLGVMYADGDGVPQDNVQAYLWFNLVAARLPAAEVQKREMAVANRDEAASKLTPAQLAMAQRLVTEWKPTK